MNADYQNYFKNYIHHIDRNNNMGLVRYILAFGVLIAHFNVVFNADMPWIISSYFSVGGFFALSGFVLFNSLLKGKGLKLYFVNRAWRIFPSYFFIVIVCSICLSFVSDLTIKNYFFSDGFWKYLFANLSFLNFIHPDLPGVFNYEAVNGSLWTMKIECQLTISAPIIIWLITKYKLNITRSIFCIILISILYRIFFQLLFENTNTEIYEILGRQFIGQFIFFTSGIYLYLIFKHIKKHINLIFIACIILFIYFEYFIYTPISYLIIIPIIISILAISCSFCKIPRIKFFENNNISYEIYLCHFPVLQLIKHFKIHEYYGIIPAFIFSILGTLIISLICYHTVGNLYLKRKNYKSSPLAVK